MKVVNARAVLWMIILVLSFGLVLIGSTWLASTLQSPPTFQAAARQARTPTPQPTAALPGNLATNPSFEEPYSPQTYTEINIANGWKAWYFDIPPCKPWKPDCYIPCPSNCIENGVCQKDYGCMWARPEYGPISYEQFTYRVHTGETAQKYFSYGRMHEGGLYQQVAGIVPGSLVEFSAWIQTWMCFDFNNCSDGRVSDQPSDMHLRIGIDPAGGTVPTSTNIIWSPEAPAFDQWKYFSVQARALGNVVTVFTHSRPEWDYARANNDVYLDDANLVIVGPPAEISSIQPTQPELAQPTTIQVTSYYPYPDAVLTITDPRSAPVVPAGGALSGSGPFVWTWQFTPKVTGSYLIQFGASALDAPLTATVSVTSVATVYALPPAPPVNVPVTIRAQTYYPYTNAALSLADPQGFSLAPIDLGQTVGPPVVWAWAFTPTITGTHTFTFSATLLQVPGRGMVFVGGDALYLPIVLK